MDTCSIGKKCLYVCSAESRFRFNILTSYVLLTTKWIAYCLSTFIDTNNCLLNFNHVPRISTPLVLVFVLLSVVVDSVLVLVFEDNESINVDLTFDSTCSPQIHFDFVDVQWFNALREMRCRHSLMQVVTAPRKQVWMLQVLDIYIESIIWKEKPNSIM